MAVVLSQYITEVRRLLHDAAGNFWSDSDLTAYINSARERVVRDTGCLRYIRQVNFLQNAETFNLSQLPNGYLDSVTVTSGGSGYANTAPTVTVSNPSTALGVVAEAQAVLDPTGDYVQYISVTNPGSGYASAPSITVTGTATATATLAQTPERNLDTLNVNLYWGNSRVPLLYRPWTQFNAELRYWQNYIGRPVAYSQYGQGQIYIQPVPDQTYVAELDCVVLPDPLVNDNSVETIIDPYTQPVKYYAAYMAKYQEQSYGEAEIFQAQYAKQVQAVLNSVFTRRMYNPYSISSG